ncbi:hypothetical protein BCR35DRAFT_333179 [Leucosporidium creatinivorum]|uniref:SnoaL-like domain-containing protein n=1 Tax=Leucosporidium creatinivorum TaxID=106004 RepID=A0A1Y2EW79_9BASI|nr:hypothetical protein BCR35DRAFT_333179 [Leucosporidium creatinivorum]
MSNTNENNKQVAIEYVNEVWGKGNVDLIDKLMNDKVKLISPLTGPLAGREALKKTIIGLRKSFPEFTSKLISPAIAETVAEGQFVVLRYSSQGKHTGPAYLDVPAGMPKLAQDNTGKQFDLTGIAWLRFEEGRIVEVVEEESALEVLSQLGLVEMKKEV